MIYYEIMINTQLKMVQNKYTIYFGYILVSSLFTNETALT